MTAPTRSGKFVVERQMCVSDDETSVVPMFVVRWHGSRPVRASLAMMFNSAGDAQRAADALNREFSPEGVQT